MLAASGAAHGTFWDRGCVLCAVGSLGFLLGLRPVDQRGMARWRGTRSVYDLKCHRVAMTRLDEMALDR